MDMGYVNALAREREGYARSNPSRVIAVDEELARLGWCVAVDGQLVRVDANRRAAPVARTSADVEARLDEAVKREAADTVSEVPEKPRSPRERRPLKAPERVVED